MCDDSEQALSPTRVCTIFECQRWEGSRQIKPPLRKNERGFWVCARCGSSYGASAFEGAEDLPVGSLSLPERRKP